MATNQILIDASDMALLLLDIQDARGEPAADGLTRLLPNLEAGKREVILNDLQVAQERRENAALPDA